MVSLTRKAINFDLDTVRMRELGIYPKGYRLLKKQLKDQGFVHRQGSGYVSRNKIDSGVVNNAIRILVQNLPWLAECVKKMDVTDIGKQYDLTNIISNYSSQKSIDPPSAQKFNQTDNTKRKLNPKDEELLSRIRKSVKGAEFDKLYRGELNGVQAEKQLMNILAFFSGENKEQMQRVFQSSAQYKEEEGTEYVAALCAQAVEKSAVKPNTFNTHTANRNSGRTR